MPFFYPDWANRPSRLIYALPLRTLAQGVYHEARQLAARLGYSVDGELDGRGRESRPPYVTLQTGEHPDDAFFDRGKIVVTTYDQVLSGLLCGPYGLSDRLHNINSAAIGGSLLVFDEFHLMQPQRAFLTAVAGLHLFRKLCQSVWMTATATQPLEDLLREALNAESIPATAKETDEMLAALPSVTAVARHFSAQNEPLSPDPILQQHRQRSIILLNTVRRAQEIFAQMRSRLVGTDTMLILLHSRFFKEDRARKEKDIRGLFGKRAEGNAILVATQVIEAGLDISCEQLHTELCPMNALVQRAGRCARFEGETATVHVYPLPPDERAWLPYGDNAREDITLAKTRAVLKHLEGQPAIKLDPKNTAKWVQDVHGEEDLKALRTGWRGRLAECLARIHQNSILRDPKRIADLIRGDDSDQIRVVIAQPANRPESPGERESLSLSRWSMARLFRDGTNIGWSWEAGDVEPWKPLRHPSDLKGTYAVCLLPTVAAYDSDSGLHLGESGKQESPLRAEPRRPGYAPLRREPWSEHALQVAKEAVRRFEREAGTAYLMNRFIAPCMAPKWATCS